MCRHDASCAVDEPRGRQREDLAGDGVDVRRSSARLDNSPAGCDSTRARRRWTRHPGADRRRRDPPDTSRWSAASAGSSFRHGGHHVAQKFRMATLPAPGRGRDFAAVDVLGGKWRQADTARREISSGRAAVTSLAGPGAEPSAWRHRCRRRHQAATGIQRALEKAIPLSYRPRGRGVAGSGRASRQAAQANDLLNNSCIARVRCRACVRVPVPVKCGCVMTGSVGAPHDGPVVASPALPAVLVLIEHVQRLVAELGELRAPASAAADRAVVQHGADDIDFLTVVDLIPERLQDLADGLGVGVAAGASAARRTRDSRRRPAAPRG